jgi:hypothetical protein
MKKAEVLERIVSDMNKRNLKKKKIISNYDYISWIEKFMLSHDSFADDSWLYNPSEISKEDLQNVRMLDIFFGALSEYCHKYYINIECDEEFEEERINLKYNGIGYQFGLVVGQGAYVYVLKKNLEGNEIAFEDIFKDTVPDDFEDKKALLQQFEQLVAEMRGMDIPLSVMMKIFNEQIK